jgi:formimidoylglutamate deiminase
MRAVLAPTALLPEGWVEQVRIEIDAAGTIVSVQPAGSAHAARRLAGPVLPGMPNLHSHAFQRAMAGLAEAGGANTFWSWRQVMYRCAAAMGPDEIEAIASQLYVELVKAGHTSVCEFHYLHHDADGSPYADPLELAWRLDAAARRAGIGLTLLPVLYRWSNFDAAAPEPEQRRFVNTADAVLAMVAAAAKAWAGDQQRRIGVAPHSLRAVAPDELAALVDGFTTVDAVGPIHLHIAEQRKEVGDCLAWSGQRPVAWLLDHAPVDRRWCLVHATHADPAELARIARCGATIGLCPTTEANLGDGVFPLGLFQRAGGCWGIGSDSHVSTDPVEALRWLDYGQRLTRQRRDVEGELGGARGAALWRRALEGGEAASGRPIGRIAPGARADLIVLDGDHPLLVGRQGDLVLDALVFAGNAVLVRDVMVGGLWQVEERRHRQEAGIAEAFRRTLAKLLLG